MSKPKGFNFYKNYWEEQAKFMDQFPWDKNKIAKLTISCDFKEQLEELEFSYHSLKNKDGKLTLKLKVPYNYYQLDDFKLKAIELLGIEKSWLTSFTLEDSHCTHPIKKN